MSALIARRTEGHTVPLAAFRRYFVTPDDSQPRTMRAHGIMLLWVQFYTRQTMKALMHGLESSFSYFGGVPSELLFDQMKAVVIEDSRYDDGALVENPEFMRYAYHWNFRIRACRPYRAQTKGKVERPIRYLRESFFYGRTFTSDDDLNAQALHWLETEANVRSHGTLKERPLDRFERERLLLEPLATRPYHPLVLPPDRSSPGTTSLPAIHVERRPLTAYAQIAGGDR